MKSGTVRYWAFFVVLVFMAVLPSPAKDQAWKQLFNGKDLSGWEQVGAGNFDVEDGLLVTHGGMGLLWWTGGKLGNCVLRVVYKTRRAADNSGVFIRIPVKPREPWMPVNYGYEVSIEYDPARWHEDNFFATGALYSFNKVPVRADHPGPQWNEMEITMDGPRTLVSVNGIKVTDYIEGQPIPPRKAGDGPAAGRRPDSGYIGLQNESADDTVMFKEVAVRSLTK